jgi:PAS domain S-box-containing protein
VRRNETHRPTAATIRVLHVDDEPGVAETTAHFLEREDDRLDVEPATSVDEGLDRLAETAFDCIVSDYDMPGRNGIEFLDTIRAEAPELPFILFTGKGSEEIASEAISAGVTDYLQKSGGREQYTLLANRIVNAVESDRSRRGSARRKRRLETLISNLPGIVYRCRNEPDWPMELVEGECEALTGYPAAALESGEVVWGEDIIHPEDADPIWDVVQDALAAGESFEVTYRVHTRDGETRWMWERGREVDPPRVDGTFLEGFITDITAAKGREIELERANALRTTLFDALPMGALAEDGNREVMAVNERFLDLFGVEGAPEDAVGMDCVVMAESVRDLFVDGERFVERTNELVAERRPVEGERLALADGRTFERGYYPIQLPDGEGHLWVYRDVTERTEREAKLDRLREQTQALMYTETKDETAEVATRAADDVIGAPLSGVHLLDESETALELRASIDRVDELFDEHPRYECGHDTGTRDALAWRVFETGEPVVVEDTAADERLTEPTPAGSALVHPLGRHGILVVSAPEPHAFDETDRTLSELLATSLRTALDRVEREAQLRRRNERLDEFTRVVSHDLRNPLGVARGRLQMAAEDREGEDPNLAAARSAIDRMDALVDDLLHLARKGETVTDPEPTALETLAEQAWRNVDTGGGRLVVERGRTVLADRGRAKQLLENLFRNAVEHSSTSPASQARQDAVEHSSTAPTSRSRASADAGDRHSAKGNGAGPGVTVTVGATEAGFYVADDGPGIPADKRDSIFDAGYSTGGGTGFGLAIVERIAEAHGWTVSVRESEAGGARFEFSGLDDR